MKRWLFPVPPLCFLITTLAVTPVAAEPAVAEGLPDLSDQSMQESERKRRFFTFLRPIVEQENRRIIEQRQRLVRLKNSGWSSDERQWITALFERYGVEPRLYDNGAWEQLLLRIDAIPVELALAQAANESAWGRSRFAREGNNFFGQWCFKKGCGFVPSQRAAGASHEVARFASPAGSVRAYMLNLNSQGAYRRFRLIRRGLKRTGKPLSAVVMVSGLERYSERGRAYVEDIRVMIRRNGKLM